LVFDRVVESLPATFGRVGKLAAESPRAAEVAKMPRCTKGPDIEVTPTVWEEGLKAVGPEAALVADEVRGRAIRTRALDEQGAARF